MCNSTGVALITSCTVAALGVACFVYWRRRKQSKLLVNPDVNYSIKLIEKQSISPDTRLFRFSLDSENQTLGLDLGQHVYLAAVINGQRVVRAYTPISPVDAKGYVTFVIKIYKSGVHPTFPEGGKMTQHLDSLKPGDQINIRGPNGLLVYEGQGCFAIKSSKKKGVLPVRRLIRKVAMIAGGSGITPMYQLIQAMLNDPTDKLDISLIYANRTEQDILLRDQLDIMAQQHGDRFHLWYTVSQSPGRDWQYDVGFVNANMIINHLPPPSASPLVLLCGPPAMVNDACKPELATLSFDAESIFVF